MEKFCVKGYLKRSGKRVLSIFLCACMIGTMIPITARAETEGTSMPSNGEVTCTCANLCTEDKVNSDCPVCGAEEADLSKCTGKAQPENNENQLNTGESEEAKNETELTITAWEWIDEEECINPETGILALPFANEETPAFFDDVVALLPTQIQATVVNEEDIEAEAASENITLGDWSCEEYPKEGAYSGSYTFAAALPEGYVLSEEDKALTVLVELGGAEMYATAEGYDENGFCTSYELTNGTWALKNDATACATHGETCNGYQPAAEEQLDYDINGDGTTDGNDKAYKITNAGQLYWFADKVNNDKENYGSAKAVLTANITVNSNLLSSLQFDSETGEVTNGENFTSWTPIGNSGDNQYTGTFDGQGHTISGLYFNTSTDFVGLFGVVGSGGSVSNVGVVDSYFKGKKHVGGVCGLNYGGTITNCYNRGTVSGSGRVGGVCGYNNYGGTIENCYNTGTVSGSGDWVGGVCGCNYAPSDRTATITNCYNTGAVSGTGLYVGGVCGDNDVYYSDNATATITNCYNRGTVSGSGNYVGGVCGFNRAYRSSNGTATITNCYNTGNVTATGTDNDYVGGVCGENAATDSSNDTVTITNCYNTGNVTATGTGNDYVGGVCGQNAAAADAHVTTITNVTTTITNCYNTGAVSGTSYVGGVCGNNSARNGTATITNCYYLANTADEYGGKTTKQFESGEVCYLLNNETTNGTQVWYQTLDSDSYPLLNSSQGTVYACTPCTGVFSNTEGQTAEHSCVVDTNDSTKHICENCGDTHDAVFTANDETNTISVCGGLGSVTLKAPTELTYDGTAKAATVEGKLTGFDTPKILYKEKDSAEAAVETAPTNAGTYVASITYTIGENTTYSVSVEYTIGKASVTVTAKNYTVKFGNPLPESLEYETDGLMGTDTLSSIGVNVTIGYKNAVTPSAIGNYIIVVNGEAATTNYTLNYVNGTLTIIEKPAQTITAADIELSYGDTGKKIGATTNGDGAISYAVASGDDVISVADDGTITALKAGTATVEITAAGTFEYAKATTTVTVTVNKAAVTIKADNKTVYQNAALPAFTYSVTGLANGGTLSFTPVLTCEAANTSTVGTYAITVSIEITEDECYTYTTQNGTLTIKKKSSGGGDNSGGSTVDGGNADDSTDAGNGYINPGTVKPTITPGIPAQGTDPAPGIGNGSKPVTDTGETTEAPFIRGENGKEGWDVIRDEVNRTQEGKTVIVDMNGSAVVPGDVLDDIKGKDVTIVFDMGGGITWSVNGKSITADRVGDIDFTVKADTNTIPVDIINNVTGGRYSKQISLSYDGEFGFTAVLSINMEASNAGLYANLFYYNEKTGEMEFICADEIAADGTAELTFTHASDYAIVIDKEPMEGSVQVDRPASESQDTETESTQTGAEVSNDAWNPWWIIVIGIMVIVIGLGVFLVAKKNKSDDE